MCLSLSCLLMNHPEIIDSFSFSGKKNPRSPLVCPVTAQFRRWRQMFISHKCNSSAFTNMGGRFVRGWDKVRGCLNVRRRRVWCHTPIMTFSRVIKGLLKADKMSTYCPDHKTINISKVKQIGIYQVIVTWKYDKEQAGNATQSWLKGNFKNVTSMLLYFYLLCILCLLHVKTHLSLH